MTDFGKLRALIVDNGSNIELARRLVRTEFSPDGFGTVYYCTNWKSAYPVINDAWIGKGFPGVTWIEDYHDLWDADKHEWKIDIAIFPDIYDGGTQCMLESQGVRVWGSRHGDRLERNRADFKAVLARAGLPVAPWHAVVGMTALHAHLKAHKNQHVKLDGGWRGMKETFFAKDYDEIRPTLLYLEAELGEYAETFCFLCEDDMEHTIDAALDIFSIDGQYPDLCMVGTEIKDCGYVGQVKWVSTLHEALTLPYAKLSETLGSYQYRNALSLELRIGKDRKPFVLDPCCRFPSPPGALEWAMITNWAEIMWEGAAGVLVEPRYTAPWGAELILKSVEAEHQYLPVSIPDNLRPYVYLHNSAKVKRPFVIPQKVGQVEVGSACGMGATLEAAVNMAERVAKHVQGLGLGYEGDALPKAQEQIAKAKAWNLA